MERFRRLTLVSAVATLVLVGVGGLVRATGSGLGCLDEWPMCRGGWTAPPDLEGVIEYSHRALAAVVLVLLVVQAVTAVRRVGRRDLAAWSWAAVALWFAQAGIGALVVFEHLHAALVTAHVLAAMGLVAITTGLWAAARTAGRPRASGPVSRMAVGAAAGTILLIAAGAYVREKGAGAVFADWPLMEGRLIPAFDGAREVVHFVHRALALLVFGHVAALTARANKDPRADVRALAWTTLALFVVQSLIGAANVWTTLAPAAVMAHVLFGALTWSSVVALAITARSDGSPAAAAPPSADAEGEAPAARRRGGAETLLAFVRLTKPRIIGLLLVTTVPAMVLAERGLPSGWLILATLLGGTLTAGSANAINQYLERDIDEKMRRTRSRPLPSHSVGPRAALAFGLLLGVAGAGWLTWTVNPLSAALATSAIVFYVGVYTVLLKRSTPQNIVIGGAAGAVPVLVGWAAVRGTVGAPAWILFAIVFFWTPPHFWALAMKYRDDYAAAGVPMMPVVRGDASTTRQILVYTLVLVPVTLALTPVAGLGIVYGVAAAGLGAGFVWLAVRLRKDPSADSAMRLFRYSISYLALLFAAVAADGLLSGPAALAG